MVILINFHSECFRMLQLFQVCKDSSLIDTFYLKFSKKHKKQHLQYTYKINLNMWNKVIILIQIVGKWTIAKSEKQYSTNIPESWSCKFDNTKRVNTETDIEEYKKKTLIESFWGKSCQTQIFILQFYLRHHGNNILAVKVDVWHVKSKHLPLVSASYMLSFFLIIIHKIYKVPNPLDSQMLKVQLVQKMKYMIHISALGKVQTWKVMVMVAG